MSLNTMQSHGILMKAMDFVWLGYAYYINICFVALVPICLKY